MQGFTDGLLLTPPVFNEEFMLELNPVSEAERVLWFIQTHSNVSCNSTLAEHTECLIPIES